MTLARTVAGSDRDRKQSPSLLARLLALGRPIVMGVLNVTPDSFSDGGRFLDPATALDQARRMVAEGADILDVGAESTRPYGGAVAVSIEEELRRLAPVLPAAVTLGVPVSIDTMKAKVAAWALGVRRRDRQRRLGPAARRGPRARGRRSCACRSSSCTTATAPIRRSTSWPTSRRSSPVRWRSRRAPASRAITSCSIPASASARRRSRVSSRSRGLPSSSPSACRCCVGASRKRFIDKVSPAPPDQRLGGSIAAHLLAVAGGAAIIRTHDVAETVQALRVNAAIRSAQ